jgi:hypothetical protein
MPLLLEEKTLAIIEKEKIPEQNFYGSESFKLAILITHQF